MAEASNLLKQGCACAMSKAGVTVLPSRQRLFKTNCYEAAVAATATIGGLLLAALMPPLFFRSQCQCYASNKIKVKFVIAAVCWLALPFGLCRNLLYTVAWSVRYRL
uniref:Uncharacterized protein n=1 Tax=Glossina palpalis gambiensis TaxID=67801 RepID=A0A1B0B1S9_9MUSC